MGFELTALRELPLAKWTNIFGQTFFVHSQIWRRTLPIFFFFLSSCRTFLLQNGSRGWDRIFLLSWLFFYNNKKIRYKFERRLIMTNFPSPVAFFLFNFSLTAFFLDSFSDKTFLLQTLRWDINSNFDTKTFLQIAQVKSLSLWCSLAVCLLKLVGVAKVCWHIWHFSFLLSSWLNGCLRARCLRRYDSWSKVDSQ